MSIEARLERIEALMEKMADASRVQALMAGVQAKDVLDAGELALMLGVGVERVRQLAREGAFPCYKHLGSWRFKKEEVNAWLTRERRDSAAEIMLHYNDARSKRLSR